MKYLHLCAYAGWLAGWVFLRKTPRRTYLEAPAFSLDSDRMGTHDVHPFARSFCLDANSVVVVVVVNPSSRKGAHKLPSIPINAVTVVTDVVVVVKTLLLLPRSEERTQLLLLLGLRM